MKKVLLTLFLSLFLINPQQIFAAEAAYTLSHPEPVPLNTDFAVAFNGKGFGNYLLSIGFPSEILRPQRLSFKVNATECARTSGNTAIYKDFKNCKVTDPNSQSWTTTVVRKGISISGTYQIILDQPEGTGRILTASFNVGSPTIPSFQTLNVKVYSASNPSFAGPFSDSISNDLTIEWNPSVAGKNYIITTTLPQFPALPLVNCPFTTCSTNFTIPKGAATGVQKVEIKEDGAATRGLTTFVIKSSSTEEPPPPIVSPLPLPLNCTEGLDTTGKLTTKENKKAEWVKCTKIDTALGSFDITPEGFVGKIFGILLSLAGGVALVLIMISGYRLMVSEGNPEKVQAAREQLTSAIVGLLFVIFSITILQIIGVDILKIPGFQ